MNAAYATLISTMRALAAYFHEGVQEALGLANQLSRFHQGREVSASRLINNPHLSAAVRAVMSAPQEDEAAIGVNRLLHQGAAAPVLAREPNGTWALHLHSLEADEEARHVAKVGSGLAVLIDDGRWAEIKECAAERCEDVFRDASKNQSRRYCSRSCANRVNAQRFRERSLG